MKVSGDRKYPARGYWRQQATCCHTGSGEQDRGVQEGQPGHLQLGDPGAACEGGALRQGERPQREQHLQGAAGRGEGPRGNAGF